MQQTSLATALKMQATELSVGDKIEARFMGVDRKNRTLSLSIRAKDEAEEKEAVEQR